MLAAELRRNGLIFEWQRVDSRADYLASLESPPDLILADYHLPQFTAVDALQELQQRGLDVPVIVVTGYVGEETVAECLKQGAADYLLKDRLNRLGQAVTERAGSKTVAGCQRTGGGQLTGKPGTLSPPG